MLLQQSHVLLNRRHAFAYTNNLSSTVMPRLTSDPANKFFG